LRSGESIKSDRRKLKVGHHRVGSWLPAKKAGYSRSVQRGCALPADSEMNRSPPTVS
jgi:hypothetical protein